MKLKGAGRKALSLFSFMKDAISIKRVQFLHPKIQEAVTQAINSAEISLGAYSAVRVVQGLRTIEEQNFLYELGRTIKNTGATPGKPFGNIVTNARGGSSYHNYGLAIDFALLYDKDKNGTFEYLSWNLVADMNRDGLADWKQVVKAFTDLGFEWGGDWKSLKDNPHFEMTFGYNWRQLLEKYKNKDFIPGTRLVNI